MLRDRQLHVKVDILHIKVDILYLQVDRFTPCRHITYKDRYFMTKGGQYYMQQSNN